MATLRTTKISPGSASKIVAGSARLSLQAMTMARGDWPSTSAASALFAFPAVAAEPAIAFHQCIKARHASLPLLGRCVSQRRQGWQAGPKSLSGRNDRDASRNPPRQGSASPTGSGSRRRPARAIMRPAADAQPQPRHGVRGSGVPEHRRMLDQEARHGDDPRRHLHPRLRLLQRQDGHAASGRSARARAYRGCGGGAGARAYRRHFGRPRRSARRRRKPVRQGHPGAAPRNAEHDDRNFDAGLPQQARQRGGGDRRGGARRLQPQPRNRSAALSDDPARARVTMPRCACSKASSARRRTSSPSPA